MPPDPNSESQIFDVHCRHEFRTLHQKLDKLTEAILGNGRAKGMKVEVAEIKKDVHINRWLVGILIAMLLGVIGELLSRVLAG